ncbi:MAG: hypothetical protein E6Q69_02735 [Aquipseudomonas alcaligenes]|uniref:Uncharacterized protein n=1 Tax=Aquipseudomonas alcaligenes TaxID=43263 RepID=A0A5C7WBW5_AQUAC|nr:MAG: hypothetical protein E6Q69_02735 [Pseudomonas alcaligenes]
MKLSKQRFSRSAINASPESAWIADVAILTTANGPLHCALVQDLKTERVLGWATALDADPTLMTRAIEVACERHTKTHPTNLFLYQISENIAPDVVASLLCREFQLRYINIPDYSLTLSMDRVWGELQRRFSQSLSKPAQFQDDLDD